MRKLIRAPDVAELLDVSRGRVYELVRRDILPHARLGKEIRFDPAALEHWIAEGGQGLPGGWRMEPEDTDATG